MAMKKRGEMSPTDQGKKAPARRGKPKTGIDKLLEEASMDDLNSVLGKISERFRDNEMAMEEYRMSLEFSQEEIVKLKDENGELKNKIRQLEKEDRRNEFHIRVTLQKCPPPLRRCVKNYNS